MTAKKNSHLSYDERCLIQQFITEGLNKTEMARRLGRDRTTIAKEIGRYRINHHSCHMKLECTQYKKCTHGRDCKPTCPDYSRFVCDKRDTHSGACNGCSIRSHCHFNKYDYKADHAQNQYRKTLVSSREGLDLDEQELDRLAEIVVPLLKQGHSPYAIAAAHPDLGICEKTCYTYVERGLFSKYGVTSLDLRLKVRRRPRKDRQILKKRQVHKHLKGRCYEDYLRFLEKEGGPETVSICQMDTVYNRPGEGVIQTFSFIQWGFLFAVFHPNKTAENMVRGVDLLENILGKEFFEKYVGLLLTDRGSEFSLAERIEFRADGSRRTHLFYCDPMSPGQKGHIEQDHSNLRMIIPKEKSFSILKLTSQEPLNIVLSHLNSYPRKSLQGKTPWETVEFFAPEVAERFRAFGLQCIPADEVTLKPSVLR